MTEITKHTPGMLCWADLATTDQDAAKSFYGKLFGWQFHDEPIPDDGVYSMALLRQKAVAALSGMDPDSQAKGIPPHWNTYIAVDDVEAVAKRAAPAGGAILAGPMDVMGEGRMAIVQDPTGATLCLWQPQKHIGASLMNEAGTLVWAELTTNDTRKAGDFYAKLLGWNRQEMPAMRYTVFAVGDKGAVGMMETPQEAAGMPSNWGVYFAVTDCDGTVAAAQKSGAKVLVAPKDIPDVGRFAVLQDPQGAMFSVLKPKMP